MRLPCLRTRGARNKRKVPPANTASCAADLGCQETEGGSETMASRPLHMRDIDFSGARRGAVVKIEPGKTKISIRLDNTVLEYFRDLVNKAGGGNYQTLINDALLEHVHRRSTLDVVREVVREELAPYVAGRQPNTRIQRPPRRHRRR